MSVSGEAARPVGGVGRGEPSARENGAAYAREAAELLADSLRPGDAFATKHLSQATVHAILALYSELRHQAGGGAGFPGGAGPAQRRPMELLAELTEELRRNTEAITEHTRALRTTAGPTR